MIYYLPGYPKVVENNNLNFILYCDELVGDIDDA
jgi:hypothetical protein